MKANTKNNHDINYKATILISGTLLICFIIIPLYFLFQLEGNFPIIVLLFVFTPILGFGWYFVFYSTPAFLLVHIGNEIQRDSSEIAKIETSYNNYSKILLMKEFGIWNYSKMAGGINKGLNTGIDFCIKIIGSDKVKSNQMLRYHILIKLYKAYLINGQYAEAQEQLILALEIEPKDILTNFWLSETYEYLDRADSAIKSYEELLNIKDIEPNLKDHILEQIDRVHTKGPRLPAKVPGLKYMSY